MFDNVAFEVVIGLVFIYLLYSLLITILGEIVSTTVGLRARLLRLAIERMLNDGFYYTIAKKRRKQKASSNTNNNNTENEEELEVRKVNNLPWFFKWRRGTVLLEHPDFTRSFAGKFYNYQAIKYLGRIETETKGTVNYSKPSYISADYFADSLINFLADKGAGNTIMERVGFCLNFNTYQIQFNTLRQFKNLYESSQTIESYKANIMKWFNETMDRTSGWHKRKMRWISFLLGFVIAAAFNVDTIQIAKILANDKEARAQLVDMGIALSKDSARYKEFITPNGDTLHSASILDSGFTRIQKDINAANLVLGIGWDFSERLKTSVVEVNNNNSSYKQLKMLTDSFNRINQQTKDAFDSLNYHKAQITTAGRSIQALYADTIIAINEAVIARRKNPSDSSDRRLRQILTSLDTLVPLQNSLSAKIKSDSAVLKANMFLQSMLVADIKAGIKNDLLTIQSVKVDGNAIMVTGQRPYTGSEKFWYVFTHIFFFSIVGFIITALALSMGAPFWFDLLNKLVSIRGVGVKPEEKKATQLTDVDKAAFKKDGSTNVPVAAIYQPPADAAEAALRIYAPQLKIIPGVKTVFTVMLKGVKSIQVNVIDEMTKKEVERLFPKMFVGQMEIPFKVVVTGMPSMQAGDKGLITNASGLNGFGSLGCIIKRTATGSKHILSCWHVLKGDLDYSHADLQTKILDHANDNHLADRWAGGIRGKFDYGIASCTDNSPYKDNSFLAAKLDIKKFKHRAVSQADIDNQVDVKYFNALRNSVTKGFIYTDTAEIEINYIDRTRVVADVLILTNDNETTISKEGNSGSIVFDKDNVAIGMIIGGDLKYTYAMKLTHFFSLHTEMEMA